MKIVVDNNNKNIEDKFCESYTRSLIINLMTILLKLPFF